MRYLGLDLGTKTLGIAISTSSLIVSPLKTLKFNKYEDLIRPLIAIIDEYKIDEVILGLPKNMDNSLGFAAQRSMDFKEYLAKEIKKPIILVDERLSTLEAEKYLINEDMSRKKRKDYIDAVAASVILNTYIRMKGNKQ